MVKKAKKGLALLLALVMVMGMGTLPMVAFAASTITENNITLTVDSSKSYQKGDTIALNVSVENSTGQTAFVKLYVVDNYEKNLINQSSMTNMRNISVAGNYTVPNDVYGTLEVLAEVQVGNSTASPVCATKSVELQVATDKVEATGVALEEDKLVIVSDAKSAWLPDITLQPDNVTDRIKSIAWSSSDTTVASYYGSFWGSYMLKVVGEGECTFTASITTYDGKEFAVELPVTIGEPKPAPATTVVLEKGDKIEITGWENSKGEWVAYELVSDMTAANWFGLTVKLVPESDEKITKAEWTSDNTDIVTVGFGTIGSGVSNTMKVTGVADGETTLTVKVTTEAGNTYEGKIPVTVKDSARPTVEPEPEPAPATTVVLEKGDKIEITGWENSKGEWVAYELVSDMTAANWFGLTVKLVPESDEKITKAEWTSDNTDIVTVGFGTIGSGVSNTMKVTGVADGETTLTVKVTTEAGNTYEGKIPVTVTNSTRPTVEHEHTLTQHEAKAATCTEIGWKAYETCSECDYTTYEKIEIDPSNHEGETETRDAVTGTCKTEGYTGDTYCLGCKTKIAEGSNTGLDASNHEGEIEVRDAVTGTCKTEGYTGDTYCLGCETKIAEGSNTGLDASNHEGETEVRDAVTGTCKTEGYTGDTYCLGCETKIAEGNSTGLDASNHEGETEVRDAVTATCTIEGYTGDTYCLGCNTKIQDGTNTGLDADNHAFVEAWTSDPTNHWHVCDNEGCEVIDAEGAHTFGEWSVDTAAQIGIEGSRHQDCTVCGYRVIETIPALPALVIPDDPTPSTPVTPDPEPSESTEPVETQEPVEELPETEPPLSEEPVETEPVETQEPEATEPAEEPGEEDLGEDETPLTETPEIEEPTEEPTEESEELTENDTPLADVPQTGDKLVVWAVLAVLSALGLAWISLTEKKGKRAIR